MTGSSPRRGERSRAERPSSSRTTDSCTRDGTYRWLHAGTQNEYDEAGAAQALLGYAIDLTERRSAKEQNAQLFGFPLALVFIAGLDGFFKRVGAGDERLLGWGEEELLSRPFSEFDERRVNFP